MPLGPPHRAAHNMAAGFPSEQVIKEGETPGWKPPDLVSNSLSPLFYSFSYTD